MKQRDTFFPTLLPNGEIRTTGYPKMGIHRYELKTQIGETYRIASVIVIRRRIPKYVYECVRHMIPVRELGKIHTFELKNIFSAQNMVMVERKQVPTEWVTLRVNAVANDLQVMIIAKDTVYTPAFKRAVEARFKLIMDDYLIPYREAFAQYLKRNKISHIQYWKK
jgi:hypothetical protein